MRGFLLDAMLGDLAKWLRILGYNAVYLPKHDDKELMDEAVKEGLTLITRDKELFKKALSKGVEAYLLSTYKCYEALAELSVVFGIRLDLNPFETRCPKCNKELKLVVSKSFEGKAPRNVLAANKILWYCESCNSIYWVGSHYRSIRRILNMAKEVRPVVANRVHMTKIMK